MLVYVGNLWRMKVLFLQTAEATYRPLLELTSQTVREYCARWGFDSECYFGNHSRFSSLAGNFQSHSIVEAPA